MLTTDLFIAIISLCITCFALGYTIGSKSNDKTQKYPFHWMSSKRGTYHPEKTWRLLFVI